MAGTTSQQNSWLVDEMYDKFRENPESLSQSWREFFADYQPGGVAGDRQRPDGATVGAAASGGEAADAAPTPKMAKKPKSKGAKADAAPEKAARPVAEPTILRGVSATIVKNMDQSLEVPTATSVRDVPAKLLEVNRRIINNYLRRSRGGKVSFTHLIAYAMLRAANDVPAMLKTYSVVDGKPAVTDHTGFYGLGIAVDVEGKDGSRSLMVPVIQDAGNLTFNEFHLAYEELIRKIRTGKLDMEMFQNGIISITNPGMIGTVSSVPRLMQGQAAIFGVGSIAFPAAYQAADPAIIAQLGVSKIITLTSTYDHRVVQGAESGRFLDRVHKLLIGEDGFYDEVFRSLGLPYEPARWRSDVSPMDVESRLEKQMRVHQLANMYRVRGHLIADLDPLRQSDVHMHPELDPTYYGLSIWDLDRDFKFDGPQGTETMKLGAILGRLRDAYCRTLGIEYMHIQDPEQKRWIQEQVEGASDELEAEDQTWILARLNAAEAFEGFLHTKYVGQKRFGLEGGESLIPMLDAMVEAAADDEISDIVVGMAHRGRLNVLTNIFGKEFGKVFSEFEGDIDEDTVQGSGDVKYHLGTRSKYEARSGNVTTLHMPPNPSHLEAVNPVVEGMARAMQDHYDLRGESFPTLPVLLHGDSAFAGQGVVAETLNLSQLPGYRTGGTIHVVINNQVGFTTAPESARSSFYSTDVAKMIQAPIIHVNGDDPEACVRAARMAFEYRQKFRRDVVIDMICYRKHGHNEADDPSFTQPVMYALIDKHRSVRKIYTEQLVKRGDISLDQAEEFLKDFEARLSAAFSETKEAKPPTQPRAIRPVEGSTVLPHVNTGVSREMIDKVANTIFSRPGDFQPHPKLERIFKRNEKRYREEGMVDWAIGEQLAFGTLLLEGNHVRLAGQDSRRGTFSHRHSVLVDHRNGEEFAPLGNLAPEGEQGKWMVYDSLLSEYAALGFEYGYSTVANQTLTLWEAQFGDFVNGAQIIIDQFIVAAEDKWGDHSGLVMLLPHGYEGQGPEHSSARIERFLTLCAEDNIQYANVTSAAQLFHLLRRQLHRDVRKPLVIATPKSLLRSQHVYSPISDLETGSFQETIDDTRFDSDGRSRDQVRTVTLCSGKVAFDLMGKRDELDSPVAIVRVEQVYPWPGAQISEILSSYPNATDIVWAQEEPGNMGPWNFVDGRIWNILDELKGDRKLRRVSRVESASPAAGQSVVHAQELEQLLDDLFGAVPS